MRLLTFFLLLICFNSYGNRNIHIIESAIDLSFSRDWKFAHAKTSADECEEVGLSSTEKYIRVNIICYSYAYGGFYAGKAEIEVIFEPSTYALISIKQFNTN